MLEYQKALSVIRKLTRGQREVVSAIMFDRLEVAEVARRVHLTANAIYCKYNRARIKMEQLGAKVKDIPHPHQGRRGHPRKHGLRHKLPVLLTPGHVDKRIARMKRLGATLRWGNRSSNNRPVVNDDTLGVQLPNAGQ